MRAAVLRSFGVPLSLETVPDPVVGTGEVVIDVAATAVLSYANEVFSGTRPYLLDLPVVPGPGAIGRVRATSPDATRLSVGDWVYADPTVRSRDGGREPDITLQGWSASSEGGLRLQQHFRDGGYAEQMRVPTENVVSIGTIDEADAGRWCALGILLVPYGGLLAADVRAGETVLISGATGGFGSAAVAAALGMGAGCVVATGRNRESLALLRERLGNRVQPVAMTGDERSDTAAILATAPRPIDVVIDLLPPAANAVQVRTAIATVRQYGRVVLMGGVRGTGDAALSLDYRWFMRNGIVVRGQWMYPPHAPASMVSLVRAGLIDLDLFDVTPFALSDVHAAIDHAASTAGPFRMTLLCP